MNHIELLNEWISRIVSQSPFRVLSQFGFIAYGRPDEDDNPSHTAYLKSKLEHAKENFAGWLSTLDQRNLREMPERLEAWHKAGRRVPMD